MLTSQIEIEHVDQFASTDTSSKADQTAATRRDWQYQGREPHPIEPWLYRLTKPRSSELTSCCRRGYHPCVLQAPFLQLSRDRADNQIEIERVDQFATRDSSSKADQTAATRRDWQYQGREPHPIEPWLCRLTRPRSSELTSCCRRGCHPCALPAPFSS